ncbi:hypothetical protein [Kitasatospora sp. NBC_01539]|uniref:hypothetical protein n=1 Tax=Kitasatospora sp. NBC_01539 TaxID=2903577 RepID=UPI0038601DFF
MRRGELRRGPGARSGHRVPSGIPEDGPAREIGDHRVLLSRPHIDSRLVVACETCGVPIPYRVLGRTATRVWRCVWLALALAGTVVAVYCLGRAFVVGGQVLEEGAPNPLDRLLPSVLGAVVVAVFGWVRWRREDGVRQRRRPKGHRGHRLRRI